MRRELATLVRDYYLDEKISQRDISEQTGIARSSLARYLRGEQDLSSSKLESLLNFFGVNISQLISEGKFNQRPKIQKQELELLDLYRGLSGIEKKSVRQYVSRLTKNRGN